MAHSPEFEPRPLWRRAMTLIGGLALIFGLYALGSAFARATGIPIPGGVSGMAMLLLLLLSGRLRTHWIAPAANLFIGHLLLLFIPAVMAVIAYPAFAGWLGVRLILTILIGVATVMASVGLSVEWAARWMERRR